MKKDKILSELHGSLIIKAKDFASEITSHNIIEKKLKTDAKISKERIANNMAVRRILIARGVIPEKVPFFLKDVKDKKVIC